MVNNNNLINKTDLSYEEMQELASHEDIQVRCQLAKRQDLKPEILYFLAEDAEKEVRRLIALNPTTPRQADLLLARDKDESVRLRLTEKIANLAPDVSAAEHSKIQSLTYDALMVLSRDQATNVRQILSETMKDLVDAPGDIIKHLAKDMEVVVAGPVLQFSPVLSDEDLLEIISSSHSVGALNAISKRQDVSESITDAVIATNEESAITNLLSNESAQIREDALDLLADRAQNVVAWHAPLTQRPKLSPKAAKRMAHYLADHLLTTLQEREDLPKEVLESVKEEVKKRIDEEKGETESEEKEIDPIDEINKIKEKGELDEAMLAKWLEDSKWLYATSCVAVMANMRRVMVKKIITSQSGKGIMALAWKAGLTPDMGETLQYRLAKIPIGSLLKANDKGEFPLTENELSWQLELFGNN